MAIDTARSTAASLRRTAGGTAGRLGAVAAVLSNRRATAEYAFNLEPSEQRRVVFVRTALKDYRKVRRVHGGTVNDVILATITGAIRSWLMTRAEAVNAGRRLRALVPMSVIDEEREPTSLGSSVVGHLLNLPIGETVAGGAPAPGLLRAPCPQRDRQGGRRRPDRGRRRLRADHLPRPGHAGRADRTTTTSTW